MLKKAIVAPTFPLAGDLTLPAPSRPRPALSRGMRLSQALFSYRSAFLNILSIRHPGFLIALFLLLCGCAVPMEEQKAHIRDGDLGFRVLSPQAFLETWGKPTYAHAENTQFFSVGKGQYIPRFRVPLGEAPPNWDSRLISDNALFLVYPDREELLGFVGDRLIHHEQLPASQLHDIGKAWQRESRFKTRLETGSSPQ